jgi:hypothetical protein
MDEDRGPEPQPPFEDVREREEPPPPEERREPDRVRPPGDGGREPKAQPVEDDITWLIYLAIGLVAFLALVVLSGMHSAMGH